MYVHKFGFNTGFTAWYPSSSMRIPRTRWGTGLDHPFIVHFDGLMRVLHACLCLTCVIKLCEYMHDKLYMEH